MAEKTDVNRLAAEARCSHVTVVRWLRGLSVNGSTDVALTHCARKLKVDVDALRGLVAAS